jgi:hypothetical protein
MSPSAQNLEAALAACLDDLQAGMTPAQCLARYPEYADQLEPLLLTAERLQGQPWPILSVGGRVRGRERMHAALASRRPAGFAWWPVLRPLLAAVVLLALAEVVAGRPAGHPFSSPHSGGNGDADPHGDCDAHRNGRRYQPSAHRD